MGGEFDSVGDLATRGPVARAAARRGSDDGAGMDRTADFEPGLCLNCGARLRGDYCAQCGQSAHIHRSIGAFGHDLLHGVLHVEGRTWRTLPLLAWRPGDLTRRYVQGERAQFVSPLALFLFAVVLLFAVASLTGGTIGEGQTAAPGLGGGMAELDRAIARQEAQVADPALTGAARVTAEEKLAESKRAQAILANVADPLHPVAGEPETRDREPVVARGNGWFGERFAHALAKARANPELVIVKVKMNAYKYGWALIPLSVPFVWLVTIGPGMSRFRLYDHMIFTTYSIAFMLLLLAAILIGVVAGVPAEILSIIGLFYPPFHMYRQLQGAYRLSRLSALIRAALLVGFAGFALATFAALLIAAGVIG